MPTRVTSRHPIGPLEGIYGGFNPHTGRGPKEDMFVSYDHVPQYVLADTLDRHGAPTRPYTVQQEPAFPGPANWGVRSAEGYLCAIHMQGAANDLGTRDQATRWAQKINTRWGLSADSTRG